MFTTGLSRSFDELPPNFLSIASLEKVSYANKWNENGRVEREAVLFYSRGFVFRVFLESRRWLEFGVDKAWDSFLLFGSSFFSKFLNKTL
jgi:hypothetical protein